MSCWKYIRVSNTIPRLEVLYSTTGPPHVPISQMNMLNIYYWHKVKHIPLSSANMMISDMLHTPVRDTYLKVGGQIFGFQNYNYQLE